MPSLSLKLVLIWFIILINPSGAEHVLEPGSTFHLDFPALPAANHSEQAPRMGVYLPDDYSSDRTYPLMVWFGGGPGSDMPNPAIDVVGKTGWVCVAVPYLLKKVWKTPWSYYEAMLGTLDQVVPNLNPAHRVCGGFSSGGAAIAWSISNSPGFRDYFYAFVPGGAGWRMGEMPDLKDRPMYVFVGAQDSRAENLAALADGGVDAGMDVTFLKYEGGHHMPTNHYPEIRDWLRKKVIRRNLASLSAAMKSDFAARRFAKAHHAAREVSEITNSDELIHAEAREILSKTTAIGEAQSKQMLEPGVSLASQKQFIEDWKGSSFIKEVKAVCISAAEGQLAKILSQQPISAIYLKRFIEIWGDLPPTREARAALEKLAEAELSQVSAIPSLGGRYRGLKAFGEKWPDTAAAERAMAMVETLASEELETIKSIEEKNRKRTLLGSFIRDYEGTEAEKQAQALLDELSNRRR